MRVRYNYSPPRGILTNALLGFFRGKGRARIVPDFDPAAGGDAGFSAVG